MIRNILNILKIGKNTNEEIRVLKSEVLHRINKTNDSLIESNKLLKKTISRDIYRAVGGND